MTLEAEVPAGLTARTRPTSPGVEVGDPTVRPRASEDADPLINQIVAGRFQVKALIGRGGVGRVYRATQVDLGRPVALKLLDCAAVQDITRRERFRREARSASRINHPGVAAVYDFGDWQEQLFIAMEYLEGRTLYQVFAAEFPLDPSRVVRLLAQVAEVLELAHNEHIIHRDLKPENVMVLVSPDGTERIKLLDFGMAILVGPQSERRLTQEGIVSGTPFYMSPEQCRAGTIDARSDVYALGIMLYEQLCGRLPFVGENPTDVLVKQLFSEPEPPSKANPRMQVPPALEDLALQAMAKDPDLRPQSAAIFAQALLSAEKNAFQRQGEVPARRSKAPVVGLDRLARAEAMGIPDTGAREPGPAVQVDSIAVLVVEEAADFATSLTAMLRSQAFNTAGPDRLDRAMQRLAHFHPDVVVVDISPDPEGHLALLTTRLHRGKLQGVPVFVVGPAESVIAMTRALELGVLDYLPREEVLRRLPRSLRRMMRRRR